MDKFEVYVDIRQLLNQGFSKAKIAKRLGISRPTLYRYLQKDPKEMADWIDSIQVRTKKLDPYKDKILSWLKENPDMSAAQVEDWLRERYSSLEISESTVRGYVRKLREDYDIPKEIRVRDYEAVPDMAMGEQTQVDFGETIQETPEKKKVKLYFIAFVLSHSRYKYVEWLDRPFTTRDLINAHENAFKWFEGIPHEMVYDQDSVIVVSENGGNLIYTKEFEVYRQQRSLKIRVCRKADPESKGRIENVVGYIKKNFAKHRIFTNIDRWNEDSWKWLSRTGNYKIHHTTKKRPVEVFQEEKHHLRPVPNPLEFSNVKPVSSITRTVRRDNTIRYLSNRYSVPLGTFNKQEKVYIQRTEEHLLIYASPNGPLMAKHKICHGKGQLIQDRQHTRDRSKGIDAYMDTVASYFTDLHLAQYFLEEIRDRYPRYIRDQLQIIMNQLKKTPQEISNHALKGCVDKRLFCATDFVDMVQHIKQQRQINVTDVRNDEVKIQPFHGQNEFITQTYAQKRDVNEYIAVLEGEK